MAEELFRVRPRFVDQVTSPMISQLLDDILLDRVLNSGEKEWILEENNVRSDKARRLIDTVIKKGDGASKKLIEHIKLRDPGLHSALELSCSQPAPLAAQPQKEQEWSTSLIHTTNEFWRDKQNDSNNYPVTRENIRNRVALLITNVKFTNGKKDRPGAEKDEENVERLLKGLGYEVVKHTNLTGQAIDDAVIKFSKHPKLKGTDNVVVVIMSHGKLGTVCGIHSQSELEDDKHPDEFPINNLYKHLGSGNCPALLNKPKIIIIQACRGAERGAVLVDHPNSGDLCADGSSGPTRGPGKGIEEDIMCVHREKDFISLLASTPETLSYRHIEDGSFLIQFVVQVFNTFAHKDDIEELFRKVMHRFESLAIRNLRQMATKDRCTLTKRFYFFPGL